MPAWFGIKFSKSKEPRQDCSPRTPSVKSERRSSKPRSFDETRKSREGGGGGFGSSGFSGFDSSSSMDRHPHPHPLPRPSTDQIHVASVSGSSLSSSTSSEGHPNHDHAQLAPLRCDAKLSPLPSPGRGSRCGTTASSPRHPQLAGLDLDTRLEDSKSEYHRLPLPPSPTSPALPTPRTSGVSECSTSNLSKWKKGRLLGRGTFGHVYVGFNSENGQMCAIKEVRVFTDDQSSKESLKQLNQEIMLLSQLSHPNIVEYIGSELGEDTLSVYLEYVSGGSIHKLLQEYGPFREPVIQNYARQILSGLAYLHARNTVHRDIKGANILVGPNGEVKLADFGMAKHITSAASMLSFKGSPYWMAPEVVMNTNGYNLAVDIWSLGCTILEMATSKPPWSQYEGVAAIFKIGNSKDIPEIPDHLSSDAKSFIRLCLQREPSARPTASQLLDHPFVRDQVSARGGSVNISKQTFAPASDGSHGSRTPPALELRGSQRSLSPGGEYSSRQVLSVPRLGLTSPRDNARAITSLPVSPSSSPLRNGASSRSYFLSPQHPSMGFAGQSSMYTSNDYPFFPSRATTRNMLEPWNDAPQLRAPTSGRSPSIRPI